MTPFLEPSWAQGIELSKDGKALIMSASNLCFSFLGTWAMPTEPVPDRTAASSHQEASGDRERLLS